MTRPDIEDYQSARRRRGETIRALNKSRAASQSRLKFGSGDVKGTPLSPFKKGDRGGMFNPNANISGGIGRRVAADPAADPRHDNPQWNAPAPEATPQQPDRSERSRARRKAIQSRIGKNSRSSSS